MDANSSTHETPPNPPCAPTAEHPRPRRLVIPALVAAVALGVAGTGVGYAVGRGAQPDAANGSPQHGSTSTDFAPPGYDQGSGGGLADSFGGPPSQGGDPGLGTGPGTAPDGQQESGSTDTTGEASGDQLTGLVRIVSTMGFDGGAGVGTGMVLTSDGQVVTNHHVVEGATSIHATVMSTGKTYTARVVGTSDSADVAVLDLADATDLDTVSLDDDGVTTGEEVTAVGDGNGTESYLSAAAGSVLATGESITTQDAATGEGESLADLIEISSDVVGGYSGGATYDADGEVIGMTTAASSGTADIVGYAIPIATVSSIVEDIDDGVRSAAYAYGYPAFLGIALGDSTTVQDVYDGTPAADAGLEAGDTITLARGPVA